MEVIFIFLISCRPTDKANQKNSSLTKEELATKNINEHSLLVKTYDIDEQGNLAVSSSGALQLSYSSPSSENAIALTESTLSKKIEFKDKNSFSVEITSDMTVIRTDTHDLLKDSCYPYFIESDLNALVVTTAHTISVKESEAWLNEIEQNFSLSSAGSFCIESTHLVSVDNQSKYGIPPQSNIVFLMHLSDHGWNPKEDLNLLGVFDFLFKGAKDVAKDVKPKA